MRSRALLVAAAAASALLVLTGCSSSPSRPAPPTQAEITAYNQKVLDATMSVAGLEGTVARETTSTDLLPSGDRWSRQFFGCLSRAGFADLDVRKYGKAWMIWNGDHSAPADTEAQIALYVCLAAHPTDPVADGHLYSAAQLQYLWTHFTRWEIPCLKLHGFSVPDVPPRSSFLARPTYPIWTPYEAARSVLPIGATTLTDESDRQLAQFESACGPTLGVLSTSE